MTRPVDSSHQDLKTDSPFGFVPTLWVCILFLCLFSLLSVVHLAQAIRYRIWWWVPTVFICGLSEVIGWSGRVWGSQNPWIMTPYLIQICCTIFAPSFMTAAMFIIFVRIVLLVGEEYSRLTPKIYSYFFVGVDLIALIIQAIGGGKAASANTSEGAQNGAHIMVGGIILQMAAITGYVLVSIEYFWRVYSERPFRIPTNAIGDGTEAAVEKGDQSKITPSPSSLSGRDRLTRPVKLMLLGLTIATVLVYVRSVYRTIELLDGWGGPIITNQTLFNCLDGIPIVLAMATLAVFHPGRLILSTGPVQKTALV